MVLKLTHVDAWGLVLEIQAVKLSKKVIWNRWSGTKNQNLEIKFFGRLFFALFGPWVNFCDTYGPETWHVDAWGPVQEIQAAKLSKKVIWNRWSGTKYQNLEIKFLGDFFCTFWALGKFLWYETSVLKLGMWTPGVGLVLEIEVVKLSKKVIWNRWSGTKYQNLEIKIFGRFFLHFLGPG